MAKTNQRTQGIVIAIDGPAGAGKSTVAKKLARTLGFSYVDTGAIYRCVALMARRNGVLPQDFSQNSPADAHLKSGAVDQALKGIIDALMRENAIRFAWKGEEHQVFLHDENVSLTIRQEANSQAASSISGRPIVRSGLLDFQRLLGAHGGVVLEGRDVGTVVFPDAELKIFLEATSQVRAKRRHLELQARGQPSDYEQVLNAIETRDRQDRERTVAPLKPADDAVVVDTTDLSIDQVVDKLQGLAAMRD